MCSCIFFFICVIVNPVNSPRIDSSRIALSICTFLLLIYEVINFPFGAFFTLWASAFHCDFESLTSKLIYVDLPWLVMQTFNGDASFSFFPLVSRYNLVVAICELFASYFVQHCSYLCNNVQCVVMVTNKKNIGNPFFIRKSQCFYQVGMTRLELATSRPPDACANQLRYIPCFCKAVQR